MTNNPPLSAAQIQQLIEQEQLPTKPDAKPTSNSVAPIPVPSDAEPQLSEIDIEKRIQQLQKGAEFRMKLTAPQLARISREADALGLSWKEHMRNKVIADVLEGTVGRSVVTSPSFASGKKVTGPSERVFKR